MIDNNQFLIRRRRALIGAGAAGFALAAPTVWAQDRVKTGTIEIQQVQVAFIGSGNLGSGALNFQGRSYRFTVGGLGVGGFGISKIEATGDVYNLRELKQFPGAYGQARYGAAVGKTGAGEMWLQNPNGVSIDLRTKRTGLALSLGADALIIDFK
jgi:hypothetical protein